MEKHTKTCIHCQQRKASNRKPTPFEPLPIPESPNLCTHSDLFGPVITAESNKQFVLCLTDAFKKYAVVTAIANKEAENGFASLASQPIFTLMEENNSAPLFEVLNVSQTKTSTTHPHCNAQVKVFNKKVKKNWSHLWKILQ